jgi:hypothetical protein
VKEQQEVGMHRWFGVIVWVAFLGLSSWAVWEVGVLGIFRSGVADPGAIQIFCDLVVACGFGSVWLYGDARSRGLNPWPWLVAVPALGSIPLLTYLVVRDSLSSPEAARALP